MGADVVLVASLLQWGSPPQPIQPHSADKQQDHPTSPHQSPAPPHTRPHRNDLGIELCRQGTGARLGMEEAVKGLHGTGCHQLERTYRLSGQPAKPQAPQPPTPASGWGEDPGPWNSGTLPTPGHSEHCHFQKPWQPEKNVHDLNRDNQETGTERF